MKKEINALIVDDSEINLFVLREALKSISVNSDMAQSGGKAIEMCRQAQYDFILMDHFMPEMDGVETTKRILAENTLPVIAMTANDDPSAKDFFIENGFTGYLQKPVDVSKLSEMLKEVLSGWTPGIHMTAAAVKDTLLTEIVAELGLDMNTAIAKIGGNEGEYKTILRIMVLISPNKLAKLTQYLEEEKWEEFRIAIHAQKGALANVGATALSAEARDMEEQAKRGEYDQIPGAFAHFRESMTQFCELLNALWPLEDEPDNEATDADIRKLPDALRRVKTHLDDLEHDEALDVLEPLLNLRFNEQISSALKSIRASLGAFDYDAAVQEIDSLLEEGTPE
ncbi:MAG: response regulator [Oscillospiraceae bacterium]|nr:response regulator [Oscillospiraceae bacterium]